MKCSAMQRRPRKGPKDKTEPSYSSESKADETPQVVNEEPPLTEDVYEEVIFEDDSLINTLPDDMLIKIFSYLTLKERICIESGESCAILHWWWLQSLILFKHNSISLFPSLWQLLSYAKKYKSIEDQFLIQRYKVQ